MVGAQRAAYLPAQRAANTTDHHTRGAQRACGYGGYTLHPLHTVTLFAAHNPSPDPDFAAWTPECLQRKSWALPPYPLRMRLRGAAVVGGWFAFFAASGRLLSQRLDTVVGSFTLRLPRVLAATHAAIRCDVRYVEAVPHAA
jgi:hypothetical protein